MTDLKNSLPFSIFEKGVMYYFQNNNNKKNHNAVQSTVKCMILLPMHII